jgi:hypothetical protein
MISMVTKYLNVFDIYVNLKQGHADNPDHLYIDVRMLFGVCLASNWFTDNQLQNLTKLSIEQSWI